MYFVWLGHPLDHRKTRKSWFVSCVRISGQRKFSPLWIPKCVYGWPSFAPHQCTCREGTSCTLCLSSVPRVSVIYLTCTMALGTVSVCLTVFVLNLHHRDAECPVPRWVRVFVLQYLAKALCVGARKPQTMAENLLVVSPGGSTVDLQTGVGKIARGGVSMIRPDMKINGYVGSDGQLRISGIRKGDHTHEWKEVAHVLDRLFFWLVFLFMTASAMIIVLVPCYKEEPKV